MPLTEKSRFLLGNLVRGLIWLVVVVALFLYLGSLVDEAHLEKYLQPIYDKPFWVFLVFTVSEVVFGIIPPEIFMLWGAQSGDIVFYTLIIMIMSFLSYGAGIIGFSIGKLLNKTRFYRYVHKHILKSYVVYLQKYGGFLVIVAALTPLPFSAIAMLVGAVGFPFKNYLLYSLFRFARFTVYSILIWNATVIL